MLKTSECVLQQVSAVRLPALPRFVASEHFKPDMGITAEVKILDIMSDFDKLLANVDEPMGESVVESYEPTWRRPLTSEEAIWKELGEGRYLSLSQLWWLLRRQSCGQEGFLKVDGNVNPALIDGHEAGILCVTAEFGAEGRESGWILGAIPFEQEGDWAYGFRVIVPRKK